MNIFIRFLSFLAITSLMLTACSDNYVTNPAQQSLTNNADHYIVILKSTGGIQSTATNRSDIMSFIKVHGISQADVTHIYENVTKGFSAYLTQAQINALNSDTKVKYIEKDQIFYLVDPVIVQNEYASKDKILAQTVPWGITSIGGSADYTGSHLAWIVDTGINLDHPDLNVSTTLSKTFVRNGQDAKSPEDYNGHGTHVSGIIAAKNNTIGVVGVAAGATVVAVKVLSRQGSGFTSDIVSGLDYVYSNATSGDVINMSLGGSASQTLDDAVSRFAGTGIYVAIAAGNDSKDAGNYSPARVNGSGIYTVSAYDSKGAFASFSNYGNPPIDYSAPGVSIYSTYKNQGYATLSGTSMAAPHVAGILLANGGTIKNNGTVTGDPDGNPDIKAGR